ncbi:PIN2 (TERF1) interacting telomerase inhibitor 1 [Phyllostomus discolor]|uniref:PIN2 (TERF1) interacting telomerase inhibitor 1 n=1 Tax=Phyllostomus discolor TaxID=89673 RepID=A0A833ZP37_9CHIR|nr:PIN2 (TERF1) interacting telomerase inhibitor 1 [Phyllostomus discolor]
MDRKQQILPQTTRKRNLSALKKSPKPPKTVFIIRNSPKGRTYHLGAKQILTAFLGKDRARRLLRMIPALLLQMGLTPPPRPPVPSPSRSTLPSGWQS